MAVSVCIESAGSAIVSACSADGDRSLILEGLGQDRSKHGNACLARTMKMHVERGGYVHPVFLS